MLYMVRQQLEQNNGWHHSESREAVYPVQLPPVLRTPAEH